MVSEMLGHTDLGITLKIYQHVDAKSIQQMHQDFMSTSEARGGWCSLIVLPVSF